jgi:hypothetical protein
MKAKAWDAPIPHASPCLYIASVVCGSQQVEFGVMILVVGSVLPLEESELISWSHVEAPQALPQDAVLETTLGVVAIFLQAALPVALKVDSGLPSGKGSELKQDEKENHDNLVGKAFASSILPSLMSSFAPRAKKA